MKMYCQKVAGMFGVRSCIATVCCLILGAFLFVGSQAVLGQEKSGLLASDTISADRAKMLGYVENHITNKFPPMMRRTVEWGEVKKNNLNQYTIRYQCEAVAIRGNECLVYCWDFTFDAVGNFVSFSKVSGFPKRPSNPFVKIVDPADKTETKKASKENAPEVRVSVANAKEAALAYEKAVELEKQGDFVAAEKNFSEAHAKNPNHYLALLGAGNAFHKQHLNAEAQKIFLKCIELRPKDSRPLEALGAVAQAEGDEEKMVEWWKKSIELNKRSAAASKGLAEYYAQKEDLKNAAMYYRLYLKTNEKDEDAKKALEQIKNKTTTENP
jgi:tetratricopeptide (TPR) repeat protein